MLLGQHCSMLSTVFNNIVEPELARNQVYNNVEQYC